MLPLVLALSLGQTPAELGKFLDQIQKPQLDWDEGKFEQFPKSTAIIGHLLKRVSAIYPSQIVPKGQGQPPIIPDKLPDKIDPDVLKKVQELGKQIPVPKPPQKLEPPKMDGRLPTENDALALAAVDIQQFGPLDSPYIRYLYIVGADIEEMQATVRTLNQISRASVPIKGFPIGQGPLMLLRVDARYYAPRADDLADWLKVWEELQFDPNFSLLITQDTLKFATGIGVDVEKEKGRQKEKFKRVEVQKDADGKPKFKANKEQQEVELLRVVSEHLDKNLVALLVQATQSQAPIVTHNYFISRALRQVQDKGVFKDILGGLYYRFIGLKKNNAKGTDEDNLYAKLGVGNVDAGITAEKLFDQLRSDQRIVKITSGITGRMRMAEVFPSLVGRDGTSIISVTHDLKQQSIDIGQSPLMNLIKFKADGKEIIFTMPNGFLGYAAANGDGALVDEVPFDIALDNTIPFPHGGRLEPGISCLRCHDRDGGWKVLDNDIKKLIKGPLDVFGDLQDNVKRSSADLDRIVGLYSGDLELKVLPRARQDLAAAVLLATGPWKSSKDQTDVVKLSGAKIGEIFENYNYKTVGAEDVLRDLGIKLNDGEIGAERLSKLLPPIPVVFDGYLTPEDARIGALKQGLRINRNEYILIFSFVATRVAVQFRK